jgi:hypothetical protein
MKSAGWRFLLDDHLTKPLGVADVERILPSLGNTKEPSPSPLSG